MTVRGVSVHLVGQRSRATTKCVCLESVSHLEAKTKKLKAGRGFFICQRAKGFPANTIVLLGAL
jgi:hypothetical protein